MDFAEVAVSTGIVRQEHLDDLLRHLKVRTFAWLVCDPPQNEPRLQGDVLLQLPVAVVAPDGTPKCQGWTAMVMNNACDLQPNRSDMVTVAPVQSFEKYAKAIMGSLPPDQAKNHLESVRANKVDEIFYLANCSQIPEGAVVYMNRLSSMSSQIYENALLDEERRVASLTQTGFYFLLMKLTKFLCRPESPEITRGNPKFA